MLVAWLSCASSGWADGPRFRGVIEMGYDFGGTDLVELTHVDGPSTTLSSGQGLRIAAGGLFSPFRVKGHSVELQAIVGGKHWSTLGHADGAATLTRWLVEALLFYRYEPAYFRVGGGLTFHIAPQLTASGTAATALGFSSIPLDSSLGAIVEADFLPPGLQELAVGIRYTFMEYTLPASGVRLASSGLGLVVSMSIDLRFKPTRW